MKLSKAVLIQRLEEFTAEVEELQRMMVAVTEQTRPVDAIETDAWCSIEFAQERLGRLADGLERLTRDARDDL